MTRAYINDHFYGKIYQNLCSYTAGLKMHYPNCLFGFVLIRFCEISRVRIMEGKGEGHENKFILKATSVNIEKEFFIPFLMLIYCALKCLWLGLCVCVLKVCFSLCRCRLR